MGHWALFKLALKHLGLLGEKAKAGVAPVPATLSRCSFLVLMGFEEKATSKNDSISYSVRSIRKH